MNKMATEPMTAGGAAEEVEVKRDRKGRLRTIIMLIVPALLIIGGAYYWLTSGRSVSTDDAQVKQDIVSVSPQVNGQVVEGAAPPMSATAGTRGSPRCRGRRRSAAPAASRGA